MANESKDQPVLGHIDGLVKEEERLYAQRELTDEDRGRLAKIKVELDQCWDLLRQRRALREFGRDPDHAKVRPAEGRRKLRTVVPAHRSVCRDPSGAPRAAGAARENSSAISGAGSTSLSRRTNSSRCSPEQAGCTSRSTSLQPRTTHP